MKTPIQPEIQPKELVRPNRVRRRKESETERNTIPAEEAPDDAFDFSTDYKFVVICGFFDVHSDNLLRQDYPSNYPSFWYSEIEVADRMVFDKRDQAVLHAISVLCRFTAHSDILRSRMTDRGEYLLDNERTRQKPLFKRAPNWNSKQGQVNFLNQMIAVLRKDYRVIGVLGRGKGEDNSYRTYRHFYIGIQSAKIYEKVSKRGRYDKTSKKTRIRAEEKTR
jgi:hypothetical protein